MDPIQIAVLLSGRVPTSHVHSALPDAPVVPDVVSAPRRSRGALAAMLRRAADVLAPSSPTLAAGTPSGATRWDESPCRPSPTMSA